MEPQIRDGHQLMLARADFDLLLAAIARRGFRLIGPALRDGAIVYDEISAAADLPAGWTDEQDAGTYRLRRREDDALFGYNVGPQSWKKYLFRASSTLWRAGRDEHGMTEAAVPAAPEVPMAFIGVRSCELRAIAVQDRVFLGGQHTDPVYAGNRDDAFLVAVTCGQAGWTCFCVSMDSGPRAESGFDLALTEFPDAGNHRFLVEASRCLSCGNCTMVCPTCFCFSVENVTDLAGTQAEQERTWDSCFTLDHSYLHGGPIRGTSPARYRQWMRHKLATWIDQFGTSGCVGCGRCVTWCPVGIDITEEATAIRFIDVREAGHGDH